MARFIYQPYHLEFLRKAYRKFSVAETARLFNEKFGLDKSPGQIHSTLKNHNITCGRAQGELTKGCLRSFTPPQKEWIKKAYKSHSLQSLHLAFNKEFNEDKSLSSLRSFIRNQRIHSGRDGRFSKGHAPANKGVKGWKAGGRAQETQFPKGHKPFNHQPVGTEIVDTDGYHKRKVAEPNKWEFIHKLTWIEHNGPIPAQHIVRFFDGNRNNCGDPDNLVLVDRGAHAILNRWNRPLAEIVDPSLKQVVINTARLQSLIKKRSDKQKESS